MLTNSADGGPAQRRKSCTMFLHKAAQSDLQRAAPLILIMGPLTHPFESCSKGSDRCSSHPLTVISSRRDRRIAVDTASACYRQSSSSCSIAHRSP